MATEKKVAKKKTKKAVGAPERPVQEPRGRFIDFAPSRNRRPLEGIRAQNGGLTPAERAKKVAELPTQRPTPDRPIDHPPVPRPPRTKPPRPVAQPEEPAVPRPPRSRVPVKRPVRVTTAGSNMPQMETPTKVVQRTTIITTADGMPEITEARPTRPRRPTRITRSGAVTMPAAPGTLDRKTSTNIGEDGFFKDSSPLMSDADLAIALAGFADDDAEDAGTVFSENLSQEAADFAEEIDALEELDEISEIGEEAELSSLGVSKELARDISDNMKGSGMTVADAVQDLEEKEREEEMEDFISEPRALFEDSEGSDRGSRGAAGALGAAGAGVSSAAAARRTPEYRPPSIDGKSPFLTSVTVEKRPLSGAAPSTEVVISGGEVVGGRLAKEAKEVQKEHKSLKLVRPKNVYAKREEAPERASAPRETVVVSAPEGGSHNVGLMIAILLTVLLGAGVGALVYLIFF